jgi:hypothetical protein
MKRKQHFAETIFTVFFHATSHEPNHTLPRRKEGKIKRSVWWAPLLTWAAPLASPAGRFVHASQANLEKCTLWSSYHTLLSFGWKREWCSRARLLHLHVAFLEWMKTEMQSTHTGNLVRNVIVVLGSVYFKFFYYFCWLVFERFKGLMPLKLKKTRSTLSSDFWQHLIFELLKSQLKK